MKVRHFKKIRLGMNSRRPIPESLTRLERRCLVLASVNYLRDDGDFNGLPLTALGNMFKLSWPALRHVLIVSIIAERGHVLWGDVVVNPHINGTGYPSVAAQVKYLRTAKGPSAHACFYPGKDELYASIDIGDYSGRPYALELALGQPQLAFRVFDLQALECYRNDPRYSYDCSDISGSISISTEHSGETGVRRSDQTVLKTFGFAYDEEGNRVVAVFLRYLSDLSPEHQQLWKARELGAKYSLHPDYYRAAILGQWPEHVSLFDAFCQELWLINQMTKAIRGEELFMRDFGEYGETRPKKFAFLLRPTVEEFNSFAHLLDKLLSDNISKKFFDGLLSLNEEIPKPDGRYEVRQKGTIRLLDEFVRQNFKTSDWTPWNECISGLRQIRQTRQKPAHALNEDRFDAKISRQQRDLAIMGYEVISTIRQVFERHERVKVLDLEIPDWLQNGKIWTH